MAMEQKETAHHTEDSAEGMDLKAQAVVHDASARGQMLTGYEELTWFQTIKTFRMSCLYATMVTIAGAADGYQIGMNGAIIAQAGYVAQFGTTKTATGAPALSAQELVAIGGTSQSLGQVIGMVLMPFVCAKFGRKVGFYGLWLILALSVMTECVSRSWPPWMIAKLLSGIGVGSLQFLTPTYIAEIIQPRIRGAMMIAYSFWFALGTLFAAIALQVMNSNDPHNWLLPVYTQWGHIGLMLIIYIIIPESPYWCALKDKPERGKRLLKRINPFIKNYDVEHQWNVVLATVEHEREVAAANAGGKWTDIFKGRDLYRTIVATWCLTGSQFLGLTVLNNYAAYFYQQVGLTNVFQLTAITKAPQLGVVLILALIIDRFGRRIVACSSLTIIWICDLGIGIVGLVPKSTQMNGLLVFFATMFTCAAQLASAIGYGFLGEIPSQRHRVHTAGFAAAVASVLGIVNNVMVPYMLSTTAWNWGTKSLFFYFGLGTLFALGSWFIIPEPAGRTFAELDEMFENKVKPWRFRKYKTATQRALDAQHAAEDTREA